MHCIICTIPWKAMDFIMLLAALCFGLLRFGHPSMLWGVPWLRPLVFSHPSMLSAVPLLRRLSVRPLTAETRFRSEANTCGICGARRGTGSGYSPKAWAWPPPPPTSIIPEMLQTLLNTASSAAFRVCLCGRTSWHPPLPLLLRTVGALSLLVLF
jgi:hypothetical protein